MQHLISWAFRSRTTGRIVVGQWPNLPLWLFLAASVARRTGLAGGAIDTGLRVVAVGALMWWAGDEVLRGVNPFRRALGAVVAAATVASIAFG